MYVNYANCCRASAATAGCLQSRFGSVFGVLYRPKELNRWLFTHMCFRSVFMLLALPVVNMVHVTSQYVTLKFESSSQVIMSSKSCKFLDTFATKYHALSETARYSTVFVLSASVFYSLRAFLSPGIRPKLSNIRDTTNNIH